MRSPSAIDLLIKYYNRDYIIFSEDRELANLRCVHPLRHDALRALLSRVNGSVEFIIVFGSSATDSISYGSDLDLVVIPKNEAWNVRNLVCELDSALECDIIGIDSIEEVEDHYLHDQFGEFGVYADILQKGVVVFSRDYEIKKYDLE